MHVYMSVCMCVCMQGHIAHTRTCCMKRWSVSTLAFGCDAIFATAATCTSPDKKVTRAPYFSATPCSQQQEEVSLEPCKQKQGLSALQVLMLNFDRQM